MKKILLPMLSIMIFVCLLISCGTTMQTEQEASGSAEAKYSMFVLIESNGDVGYRVVYHKDTKVMYSISDGVYGHGVFTVLLNPDGTPMLWKSEGIK